MSSTMKVDPRFLTEEGPQVFTGNELLLKGALETEGGVHLLGGYPGSPIAGFFDAISTMKDLLNEKGIHAVINNNEALAAAMLNGSQTLDCRAIIVMKSVGVHVAADALALGNLAGANPHGGAIVVYGDDPWSDSTQVAADSRYISKHLFIPVIEPASGQEVKDYIGLALKLSAGAELFSGFVLTNNLADGGGTVQCGPNHYPTLNLNDPITLATADLNLDKRVLLPPRTWWQEESLTDRFSRAMAIARDLGLNRIDYPATSKKPVGFATSGLAHSYLTQVLAEMGLLGEFPILKFGMSYPVDPSFVREMAEQCERIVVVEERRGFLEEQISEILVRDRQDGLPSGNLELWGKRFPFGLPGIPDTRGLHPSILIDRLAPLLDKLRGAAGAAVVPGAETLAREVETMQQTGRTEVGSLPTRLASFCPGCPHRDSAAVCLDIKKHFMNPKYMKKHHGRETVDLMFHGDTGCYTMLMFPPNSQLMHDYSGMGLGGGTGSGTDKFTRNKEATFMGDSTFFHSGQIAISQAVKLGQDITFIILDNSTTAMTGHQPTPGVDYDLLGKETQVQDIEDIVRGMDTSGTLKIVRANPELREPYQRLLEETFLTDGVKVIIADKECGITRMRRKRREEREVTRQLGFLPTWQHMNVNQDVCRFCLSCAEETGCPGLKHVETDYGRKIDTDITWCVDDGACQRVGACWSFERVTIKRKKPPRTRLPELGLDDIPEPEKRPLGDIWRACLVGVGGMGIGVATSIVVRAGHKEGYRVAFLDKKGLAIRNGGVASQVAYNMTDRPTTSIIPYGQADLLIGMDILEAVRAMDPTGRIRIATKDKTAAVINTDKVNTIRGVMGQEDFDPDELDKILRKHTRDEDYLARNISKICEAYLGSKLYANIMMLGFAFQKGLIPVSMHSMAWAIKDTIRAHFRKNLYAFNMGRKLVVQPDLFQGAPKRTGWRETLEDKCRHTIRRHGGRQRLASELRELAAATAEKLDAVEEKLCRSLVVRIYDCMRWGGMSYAKRYADQVVSVYEKDHAEQGYAATRAVIHNLAKSMLIKDAIFVAELSTSPEKYARDRRKYNVNPANGDRIVYRHLLPIDLRFRGKQRRTTLTARHWMLQALRSMRWLRKILPNWHTVERKQLAQYEKLVADFRWDSPLEYKEQATRLSSARCMSCLNPQCQQAGCPLSNEIPTWLQLVYQDRWREAADVLHGQNNFPEMTSRVCPALCQSACKQGISGFDVQIKDIEYQIIERAFREGWVVPRPAERKTGRAVAVVGSGPAGLTAAQQLARAGHDVTVFEKDEKPGGLLRYGIPDFRLEKELVDRRVEQLEAEGVTFRCGVDAGADVTGIELREQFDAICLATGAAAPRDLDVPGRQQKGIHYALDYLRQENRLNAGVEPPADQRISAADKIVAVIGGGLTGEDCVETALKQGAKEVHQFEILPQASVDGDGHGEDEAPPEQLTRRWCVATKAFGGDGRLSDLQAVRVQWTPSPTGPVMSEMSGSDFRMKVDLALLAVGFDATVAPPLAEQLGLQTDEAGTVAIRDSATNVDGVYAAGDLVLGASYVVSAIDSGRKAAARIEQYLAKQPEPAAV